MEIYHDLPRFPSAGPRNLSLEARARVELADPHALIPVVATHLEELGASVVDADGEDTVLEFEFCRDVLRAGNGALLLRAEVPNPPFLDEIKSELALHVEELTRLPPDPSRRRATWVQWIGRPTFAF